MRLNFKNPIGFQEQSIPEASKLAGFAAIVNTLSIEAPVSRPSCVSDKHIRGSLREEASWTVFDRRYWPGDSFGDHLSFALRHEQIDLLVLKRIFETVPAASVAQFVREAPNGIPNRRAWFLYELLTGRSLKNVSDAQNVTAIDVLDPEAYFTGKPRLSRRHRVRDNLLGIGRFCPIIRRTKLLTEFITQDLAKKASETIGRSSASLVARAASFMLLADSRASFEIEGERPPRNRLERWGRAVLQAGKNRLTLDEIVRLHGVLIEDSRFVRTGLRSEGVFLGERDHSGDPLPEFIGARAEDLTDLMSALLKANDRMTADEIDPVLQSAATTFGFVYVHPLQDGNGRLHRCLIHHVLAERKFTPPGIVFPASSVMLDRIDQYRTVLQSHSGPLMRFIDWRPTPQRNVEVLNDTADLYRYFDCTETAEFLYSCVQRTVQFDLPREIDFLRQHDEALRRIMARVDMPDRLAKDFIMFVQQNHGALPNKRRSHEFSKLSDDEVAALEAEVRESFENSKKSDNALNDITRSES